MKEKIKSFGMIAGGLAIMVAMILLPVLFMKGAVQVGEWLFPFANVVSEVTTTITLFVLIPCAIIKRSRGFAAIGLLIASYVFGFTLWLLGLLVSYSIWGLLGLIIGLFLAGIGVVPVAMIACVFTGKWGIFKILVYGLISTIGTRMLSYYLVASYEKFRSRKGVLRVPQGDGRIVEVEVDNPKT